MIQRTQRRLSRIEDFFSRLLTKGKVSKNIFVGDLPPTTSKDWSDFVLVDIGQQKDRNAYSFGYANIYLYARPKGSPPRKNVALLDKMEEALSNAIGTSNDTSYSIKELYRDCGYDTNRQFHYNIVSVSVFTK
nr:MAG TPA: hypothetical protein [Caudoviricetes sp.]